MQRTNFFFLAFKHFTNEEKLTITRSILLKVQNGTTNFTEREIACIKHFCKNDHLFANFVGGANDQPLIRGRNVCNTSYILGINEYAKFRLNFVLQRENTSILNEIARVRGVNSINNITN
jgi:hypothetical protein